ncbi:MAG: hypothetical protein E6K10_07055 [Methanobacteriota archaeon]|nr:MAG: hypothetical protein E6K10_07055 [Euryarchaeota archaeon]
MTRGEGRERPSVSRGRSSAVANGDGWRAKLVRWFAYGQPDEPYKPPQKRTWAEKITDDGNAWLLARRLELEGDLLGATRAYAQDGEFWRGQGHYARAALSTASAARCLEIRGIDPLLGFTRAGALYVEAGKQALDRDPREALQLFELATECFARSGNGGQAEASAICDSLRNALDSSRGHR